MGFLFLVLYPPPRPPVLLLTHLTHTHTLTHSLTQSFTHTHSLSHTHTLTHSLTRVPGSPPLLRGRRGTMCTVKGSDVPGFPLASLGLRLFCVAGVGQCALPRGRMYALGFRWRPWVSASFAWQAWDNVHCQGVGCMPRGSAGVPGSPPLLRGRRGTMCIVKGSDVRPGVPLASLGLRLFCVAGVGQCALPRGRMYLGFRWRPWVSASFAWQAWDNVHCQGVGCTPWVSAGVPGSPPLLRGRRGTMCTAKGLDVRPGVPLASLGLRLFCVAGVVLLLIHLTHSHTHTLTHSLTDSLIHSLTHSLTHSLIHSLPHSLPPSLTHSLSHSLYMNIHTYTQTHPPSPLHHSYTSSSLLAFL